VAFLAGQRQVDEAVVLSTATEMQNELGVAVESEPR
jgi:hypothetical protein